MGKSLSKAAERWEKLQSGYHALDRPLTLGLQVYALCQANIYCRLWVHYGTLWLGPTSAADEGDGCSDKEMSDVGKEFDRVADLQ